jgi:hypothetical protein
MMATKEQILNELWKDLKQRGNWYIYLHVGPIPALLVRVGDGWQFCRLAKTPKWDDDPDAQVAAWRAETASRHATAAAIIYMTNDLTVPSESTGTALVCQAEFADQPEAFVTMVWDIEGSGIANRRFGPYMPRPSLFSAP